MKRVLIIFAVSFLNILLTAQNSPSVVGKWKVAAIEITNVLKANKGSKADLADTSSNKERTFINNFALGISKEYLNSSIVLTNKHQLKIKSKHTKHKGTYEYDAKENVLTTSLVNFNKLYITSFTADTLIVNKVDENEIFKMTLIRK
ncbi:MAG: hypothetical protein U0V72_08070 [Cytophagales bacterium]